ncbi:hypothetical protein [Mariniblastus fucicola]|uniref:Autotransporter-associated beta strand repeat protein n=2 Tax=Mariniblastus fucicola TaxID=980251 RepID=A0A5B9P8S5_9BACT|nr:hypothetical protein [Mariniblastus fucicola]QEG21026.1 hypothetical protein MFFC18_08780 [Mariniblastus fucicola]
MHAHSKVILVVLSLFVATPMAVHAQGRNLFWNYPQAPFDGFHRGLNWQIEGTNDSPLGLADADHLFFDKDHGTSVAWDRYSDPWHSDVLNSRSASLQVSRGQVRMYGTHEYSMTLTGPDAIHDVTGSANLLGENTVLSIGDENNPFKRQFTLSVEDDFAINENGSLRIYDKGVVKTNTLSMGDSFYANLHIFDGGEMEVVDTAWFGKTNTPSPAGTGYYSYVTVESGGQFSSKDLFIGDGNGARLNINGGLVDVGQTVVANQDKSLAELHVNTDGILRTADLTIGNFGVASATAGQNSTIDAKHTVIGGELGGRGTLLTSGTDIDFQTLTLGDKGNGFLLLEEDSFLTTGVAHLGVESGSSGKLNLFDSVWNSTETTIGEMTDSNGTVDVYRSHFETGDLRVGKNGFGRLRIFDGSVITNSDVYVGGRDPGDPPAGGVVIGAAYGTGIIDVDLIDTTNGEAAWTMDSLNIGARSDIDANYGLVRVKARLAETEDLTVNNTGTLEINGGLFAANGKTLIRDGGKVQLNAGVFRLNEISQESLDRVEHYGGRIGLLGDYDLVDTIPSMILSRTDLLESGRGFEIDGQAHINSSTVVDIDGGTFRARNLENHGVINNFYGSVNDFATPEQTGSAFQNYGTINSTGGSFECSVINNSGGVIHTHETTDPFNEVSRFKHVENHGALNIDGSTSIEMNNFGSVTVGSGSINPSNLVVSLMGDNRGVLEAFSGAYVDLAPTLSIDQGEFRVGRFTNHSGGTIRAKEFAAFDVNSSLVGTAMAFHTGSNLEIERNAYFGISGNTFFQEGTIVSGDGILFIGDAVEIGSNLTTEEIRINAGGITLVGEKVDIDNSVSAQEFGTQVEIGTEGRLVVDIRRSNGRDSNFEYDQFIFDKDVFLDGTLEIRFDEALLVGPEVGFDILEYRGGAFGQFAEIVTNARSFGFVASDLELSSSGRLTFSTAAVPEPSAMIVMLGITLCVASSRHRRKHIQR